MAIGSQCGVGGFIVPWMADGYRVSMWNGDDSRLRD